MRLQHTIATAKENSFRFLERITDNFSDDRIIGCGGFGVVYKGILDNGQVIAVKKISYNGVAQFENELMIHLMGLDHKNIVQLVGYCDDKRHTNAEYEGKVVLAVVEERALCLEYMPGGSLDGHLSGIYDSPGHLATFFNARQRNGSFSLANALFTFIDESCGLEWHERFKIIKGICEGLKYLHTAFKDSIYHLDLKPANILLDKYMRSKIGDFGISRLLGSMQTCVTETITGTL